MRTFLITLVLVGCSQSHMNDEPACEAMGGWCQTPDLPCGEGAWWAGGSLCEQEYDACCVSEPAVDAGAAPDTTVPDMAAELCEQLCHPDRCGFPFQSPVDDCLDHCLAAIPRCDDAALSELEACVGYCDSFVPCVYDVSCIQP